MVDQFIESARMISEQLIPILGVIALIFLCIFLSKASKLLGTLTTTVKELDGTISLVEKTIEKAQTPLDTAVKLSHTVDEVHDKSYDAIKQASGYVVENFSTVKDYFVSKTGKETPSVAEPNEDMTKIMRRMSEVIIDED
ncbi:MAG: hypothetical protein ACK5LZ_04585 [Anaerorhabdus sp.]